MAINLPAAIVREACPYPYVDSRFLDHQGVGGTMSPDKDDQKKDQRDDHHDDANPMPDTHHVNPDSDDESEKK
tara:strand:- start:326 stop:544 length:219 start_codon:yes stop_codon:yes gene_type:complete